MVNIYKFLSQNEDDNETFVVATPQPTAPEEEPTMKRSVDDKDDSDSAKKVTPTKKESCGACVGGAVIGMCIGGPVLSVIGGFGAVKLTEYNTKTGKFCREGGKKVANVVIKGCDFVKAKMEEDGDESGTVIIEVDSNQQQDQPSHSQPSVKVEKTGA